MKDTLTEIERRAAEDTYKGIVREAKRLDHWTFKRYKAGLHLRREAFERGLAYYAALIADPDNGWELDVLMKAAAAVRGGISALERAERELTYNNRNGQGKETKESR